MALILLVVIGAILGWLASIITRTEDRGGILTDIGVGIGGSLVAGLLVGSGSIIGGLSTTALFAAIAGAIVSLGVLKIIVRNRADA